MLISSPTYSNFEKIMRFKKKKWYHFLAKSPLKSNKTIPDLVIRASHLSGINGVDCDLDGANHIVDFKTLQGLSHYDTTFVRQHLSTIPGATLE